MFTFISIMAVGVLIGYPLRRKQSIHKIPVLIQIVVCLLLLFWDCLSEQINLSLAT